MNYVYRCDFCGAYATDPVAPPPAPKCCKGKPMTLVGIYPREFPR